MCSGLLQPLGSLPRDAHRRASSKTRHLLSAVRGLEGSLNSGTPQVSRPCEHGERGSAVRAARVASARALTFVLQTKAAGAVGGS